MESLPLPLLIEVATDRDALNRPSLELSACRPRRRARSSTTMPPGGGRWSPPPSGCGSSRSAASGCWRWRWLAALGLAAQAAIGGGGPVIRTLRLVGARDDFIARGVRPAAGAARGARGGARDGGGDAAARRCCRAASEQGFFLVGIGLAGWHWLLPLLVPPAAAALAWAATRQARARGLRRWS